MKSLWLACAGKALWLKHVSRLIIIRKKGAANRCSLSDKQTHITGVYRIIILQSFDHENFETTLHKIIIYISIIAFK